MWNEILWTTLGAFFGWAAVMTVIFYFLGFPPFLEFLNVLFRTIIPGGLS